MNPSPYAWLVGVTLALTYVGTDSEKAKAQTANLRGEAPGDTTGLARWSSALKRSDPSKRASTLYEIAGLGPKAKAAVPLAAGSLKSDTAANVRRMAAVALGEMGPRARFCK